MSLTMIACKEPETEKVTLTFYDSDGKTVLATQEVEKGGVPTRPEDPKKEGYKFKGWFVTPTSKMAFDFSYALNEDGKAYAQWQSTNYEDDRDWVISGTMNGWGSDLSEKYHMTKVEGKGNVFTLTLDLRVDDEFQLTVLLADGTLSYSNEGARATDKHLVDGAEYMEGKGGLSTYKNIAVKVEGNYTLTLTSDAETDNNSLSVKRNGDAKPLEEEEVVNYYIKGAGITKWTNAYVDNAHFILKDGENVLTITLKEGEEFMFYGVKTIGDTTTENGVYFNSANLDEGSLALFDSKQTDADGKPAGDIVAKATGIYTFVLDVDDKVISATMAPADETEYVYYIDGGILDGTWGDYQKAENSAKYKMTKNGDVYTIEGVELKAGEELVVRAHKASETVLDWDNVAAAYNATSLSGSVGFGPASKTNANIKVENDGVYTVSFDSYTKIITIAKAGKEVYIKGTVNATAWDHAFSEDYLLVVSEDNADVYEITIDFAENDEFGLAVYNVGEKSGNGEWAGKADLGKTGDANSVFVIEGKGNLTCSVAGTYKITYNYRTKIIEIYSVEK